MTRFCLDYLTWHSFMGRGFNTPNLCLGVEYTGGSIITQATRISRKTLTVKDTDPAGDVANPFFSFKVLLRSEIINIRITSSKLDDSLPCLCFYWLVGPHISYLRQ